MAARRPLDVTEELLLSFDHCARVSEYLAGVLPARLWRADAPRGGRSIGHIFAHMQSVRRTFAKMGGAPPISPMDRDRVTPAAARRQLRVSREALTRLFRTALTGGHARVKGMPRRAVDMMTYIIQHEAHHRGQICMLARSLGHRFAGEDITRMWGWRKL
jgi:uncharacterized damage-inducible protein DinB